MSDEAYILLLRRQIRQLRDGLVVINSIARNPKIYGGIVSALDRIKCRSRDDYGSTSSDRPVTLGTGKIPTTSK